MVGTVELVGDACQDLLFAGSGRIGGCRWAGDKHHKRSGQHNQHRFHCTACPQRSIYFITIYFSIYYMILFEEYPLAVSKYICKTTCTARGAFAILTNVTDSRV